MYPESLILKELILKNGQKLLLRMPSPEDAVKMLQYLNTVGGESDNLLFGKDEFKLSVEQETEYLKKIGEDSNTLMIVGIINDRIISVSQVSGLGRKRICHNSELSISVLKDCWGIGVGNAVMEELIRFAKGHPVIKNISLGVRANNSNAIRLYEKYGFKKVGLHMDYFDINGIYDDEILMDLSL